MRGERATGSSAAPNGIKAEGAWHARTHRGAKRRLWRKVHIGVDERTPEIRAIEITGSSVGDAPMPAALLGPIPADVAIGAVTAVGACGPGECHHAVADRGAHAVGPPRRSPRPWRPSTAGATARNQALRIEMPRPRDLAKVERLAPPKPRRDDDGL